MNTFPQSGSRRRLLVALPAIALAATSLTVTGSAAAQQSGPASATIGSDEYYINYAEPAVQPDSTGKEVKGAGGVYAPALDNARAYDRKYAGGNPTTARELAKLEAKAIKTGQNPRQIKQAKGTQTAKLLTLLVEFNDQANDDFTNVYVPQTVFEDRSCVLGTVQNGPKHNNIPDPASLPHEDNNSMWVPDFSPEHFDKMLYTKEGITERVRNDLTGPDGKPGVSLAGRTMHNMYLEMSKGAYTVDGQASPWITVPHSEAWYAASRCFKNDKGEWVAGAMQSMNGHPDNPLGAGRLATDAIDALAKMDPDFPWADYDLEDQGDRDGDGNVNEPDGVIDHLVLVHAGMGKSRGGGDQGVYAVWAHSSAVAGGYTIPGTNLKVSNYIVQPEDAGVGVFAHEFGHDLGLPDLYDTSGNNSDSDVDFWDLMASGSHTGEIFQALPTHMGLWDKWVLGWADPLNVNPGSDPRDVQLGQTSNTPVGTKDGIKINLPNKVITLADPHSGANMWYSGADQDWADVKLTRQVTVPAAADAKFWMWNNYVIEQDWDYGFVEVSTNGGSSWTELKVYDAAGNLVSTDDGYADPNGRMGDYGGKKYGLTGDSHGWRHDWVDLSAYAGQTVQVRLRYATDAGFLERGWFADDFSVTGGATTWSDDVEGGANGWTQAGGTWTDTAGAGWHVDSGTQVKAHYYLAEWRNFDGFDKGLKYAYDTVYSHEAWKVDRIAYNAPGMLVWYRDTALGNVNHVTAQLTTLPSYGAKGGLLIVDSHNQPLRRQGEAAVKDPSTLDNLPSRPQSSNAAFSLGSTYPFNECLEAAGEPYSEYCTSFGAQGPVAGFTDAKGWYPGLEHRTINGQLRFFARDADASVVIPSRGNAAYSIRITNPDGTPATSLYGTDPLGIGVLGTGNPGDAGVSYGVTVTILKAAKDNSYATVHVTAATP